MLLFAAGFRFELARFVPVALNTRDGLPEGGLTTPLGATFLLARI